MTDGPDNCDLVANADQADSNRNGTGDLCEDPDGDGVVNATDNCPMVKNFAQQDEDQDGVGGDLLPQRLLHRATSSVRNTRW